MAYELWVHQDKPPQAVAVDGKALPMLESLAAFASVGEGWYHGAGCFHGSEAQKTTNIKLNKSNRVRTITIK